MGCDGVVGVGVKCSVKVCIKGSCGVSVGVGVFKISNQDQRVCQGYMSGHGYNYVKSVAMSQYPSMSQCLFQGDESGVGMSEGVTSWMLC